MSTLLIFVMTVAFLFSCRSTAVKSDIKENYNTQKNPVRMPLANCTYPDPSDDSSRLYFAMVSVDDQILFEEESDAFGAAPVKATKVQSNDFIQYNATGVSVQIDLNKQSRIRRFESKLTYISDGSPVSTPAECTVFDQFDKGSKIIEKFTCDGNFVNQADFEEQVYLMVQSTENRTILTLTRTEDFADESPILRQFAAKNLGADISSYETQDKETNFLLDLKSRKEKNIFGAEVKFKKIVTVDDDNQQPKKVVMSINAKMQCYLPDYIGSKDVAANIKMVGSVAGVDPVAFNELNSSLNSYKNSGTLKSVKETGIGDEGGRFFCITAKSNADLRSVISNLKKIQVNQWTEYHIDAMPHCL